jgi:hypothetical protein
MKSSHDHTLAADAKGCADEARRLTEEEKTPQIPWNVKATKLDGLNRGAGYHPDLSAQSVRKE